MEKSVVNFQLENIELSKMFIAEQPENLDSERYHYNISVNHRFNLEAEVIAVIASVDILAEKKHKLAEIGINIFYKVENLKNFENRKDKKMELPADFLTAVNSVSISTLRGVVFSQLRGTYLHNALLPVIDPKNLLQNP